MKAVRFGFFVSLVVWLGGALITYEYGTAAKQLQMLAGASSSDLTMMNLRGLSINLFGPIAIVLGLILAVAWVIGRLKARDDPSLSLVAADSSEVADDQSAAHLEMPAPSPESLREEELRCDFSGWTRDGERIVQEYAFRGQGVSHNLAVEITVERGAISLLRFVNFWLIPSNGYEGDAEVRLIDESTGKSPGWLKARMATAAGDATLINIPERRAADAAFELFSASGALVFTLRQAGEELLSLPLPNGDGLLECYDALRRELSPSSS